MLTLQQIYQRVCAHLLAQRAVSEDENGSCRLRGPLGRRCAIGSLVADDHYDAALEGIGIAYYRGGTDGSLPRALRASGIDSRQLDVLDLLVELEDIHDNGDPGNWQDRLAELGERRGFVAQQVA
jgi:hypothetical protein